MSTCHETFCERFGALALGVLLALTVAACTLVYWPADFNDDAVNATYAVAIALAVAQALAMQVRRCFAGGSTLVGAVHGAHASTLVALAGAWWMRYAYESRVSTTDAMHSVGQCLPSKAELVHDAAVHRTAQFASATGGAALAMCVGRWMAAAWLGTRVSRHDGARQAMAPAARRRRPAARTREIELYTDDEFDGRTLETDDEVEGGSGRRE